MAKGKLILICQCGGEFVKNVDGSLKYNGGEAQAVNIDSETQFDDLKLKLAELCNLDFKSVVVKYFLPGNTRTLINLSSDKELKRMLEFHGKSVTAEVFVTGTVGFNREAVNIDIRDTTIKVAESANRAAVPTTESPVVPPPSSAATEKNATGKKSAAGRKKKITATQKKVTATQEKVTGTQEKVPSTQKKDTATQKKASATQKKASATPKKASATPKKASATPKKATQKKAVKAKTPVGRKRKHIYTESVVEDATSDSATKGTDASDDSDIDYSATPLRSLVSAATKGSASTAVEMDMSANPADTVKKRRRLAASKSGGNGSATAIAIVPDKRMSKKPHKMKGRKRKSQSLVIDEEREPDSKSDEDDIEASFADDGPLGKLVSSWKKAIKRVGQDFTDAAEFRDVLQKYALARRFVYKLKKNEATRVSARCVIESCSWKLLACWVPTDDVFRVKTFNKSHSCGGESWRAAHPNRRIFVNFIREKLRNSPHQKVKDIANSLSRDFGLELNISQVRRGINDAREQLQGSYQEAYNQLPLYCDQIAAANPMSFVKYETNEEKRFQRLFISFHASIHGFEIGCRPLLFLETTSMKSKCKEKLLTATALDGNDGLFPLAFAVVDNENNDSWRWFLEMLRSTLPATSGPFTFVSDREKGLKEVVLGIFGDAYIGYSIYHLLQRFMRSIKRPFQGQGRSSLPGFLLGAAQTIRFNVFKTFVEKIMKVSPEAYDWLMQVEPEYWASTSFKGEPYNHITQNVAESYIKLMEEKRESTITHKLEALMYMISELMNSRRTEPTTWPSKLTLPKQDKLREEFAESRGLKVLFSSDTVFEVREEVSHVVNLNITECTCLVWQRTGIPCRHAIAVFNCTNRNIYDYCSRYYTTDTYLLTYSKSIYPIDRPAEIEESDPAAVQMKPPQPPRPWSSQPRKRLAKTLEIQGIDSCKAGSEGGQMEALSGGNNVVGEGNLIAAFDANGQVRDHNEIDDEVNVEALLEDCHEVAIEGDPEASLDSVVEVTCEVVDQGVTTENNNETMTQILVKVPGEDDPASLVEDTYEISLDENREDKFNADHDLFGEVNYDIMTSDEINDEVSHEIDTSLVDVSGKVSTEALVEVRGKVSTGANDDTSFKVNEANDEVLTENNDAFCETTNNEPSYEANANASFDAQKENDDGPRESIK